jgi:hypothetical protein
MKPSHKITAGLVATGLAASAGVQAQDFLDPGDLFKINLTGAPTTGAEVIGAVDGVTGTIRQLGWSGYLATSIYDADTFAGIGPGTKIYDSNIPSILQGFGIAAGENDYPAADGGTVSLKGQPDFPLEANRDSLNFDPGNLPNAGDTEGFTGGVPGAGQWGLVADYYLEGEILAGPEPVKYNDGFLDLFYFTGDETTKKQVARFDIEESFLTAPSLFLFGEVVYDTDGDGLDDPWVDDFVKNFFVDVETNKTFYEIYSGDANPPYLGVAYQLDTNVVPTLPTPDQLGEINGVAPGELVASDRLARQSNLDGSEIFAKTVPTPGTLALLGIGLFGASWMRRRKPTC